MNDNINHPQHYEGHTSLECIDAMEISFDNEAVAYFCLCNAFKYLWRHKHKNGLEDLEKAEWYLERFNGYDLFEPYHHIYCAYEKMKALCEKEKQEIMKSTRKINDAVAEEFGIQSSVLQVRMDSTASDGCGWVD